LKARLGNHAAYRRGQLEDYRNDDEDEDQRAEAEGDIASHAGSPFVMGL